MNPTPGSLDSEHNSSMLALARSDLDFIALQPRTFRPLNPKLEN